MTLSFKTGPAAIAGCFADFLRDEEGSATVEMVVMMSAGITLAIATMNMVSSGVENLSTDISDFLSDIEISTSFADGKQNNQP